MFARFDTHTSLSVSEVVTALSQNVSRQPWFGHASTPFVGSVSVESFRLMRVVRELDSFNPMLYGRIRQAPTGSTLHVVATLHPIVWTLMTVWSSAFTVVMWRGGSPPNGVDVLITVLFILGPWVMAAAFFPSNFAKSRELLETCLQTSGRKEYGT
jgi:hypothetical protein